MATLKNVQMGWKGLEDVINRLIGAVNGNEPLEGSGIRIVDTDNGKLISVASETTGGGGGSAGGGGGGTQTQDPHILATELRWLGKKWQAVTVVDPASCAQSTLTVLVNTENPDDFISIPLTFPFWASPIPSASSPSVPTPQP